MKARGSLAALLLPIALLAALLGGCGDSDSTATDPAASDSSSTATDPPTESADPSESATASDPPALPDWPPCAEVWVADAQLPNGYRGCLDGDAEVQADNLTCSSGQRLVRYDDRFFAVPGGKIYETSGPLEKDKLYLKKVRTCRA